MRVQVAIALALVCLSSGVLSGAVVNRCLPYFKNDMISFDLVTVSPSDSSRPLVGELNNDGDKYIFLPCSPINLNNVQDSNLATACSQNSQDGSLLYLYTSADNQCSKPLTNLNSVISYSELKTGSSTSGVQVTYTPQAKDDTVDGRTLLLNFNCNKDISDSANTWEIDRTQPGKVILTTSSAAGCGLSMNDFFNFFNSNAILFGAGFIIVGLIFAFFGKRWFTYVLVFTGFLIGFFFVVGLAYATSNLNGDNTKKKLVFLGLGTMLGALLAFGFYSFKKVTTLAGVGLLFFLIANAIFRFGLATVYSKVWFQWSFIGIMVVIGMVIGYFYSDICIIFSTSLAGSFLAVYSVGMLTGTLDSPSVIEAKIRAGENNTWMYVYGAVWTGLSICSLAYQCRVHRESKEEEDTKSDEFKDYKSYN